MTLYTGGMGVGSGEKGKLEAKKSKKELILILSIHTRRSSSGGGCGPLSLVARKTGIQPLHRRLHLVVMKQSRCSVGDKGRRAGKMRWRVCSRRVVCLQKVPFRSKRK